MPSLRAWCDSCATRPAKSPQDCPNQRGSRRGGGAQDGAAPVTDSRKGRRNAAGVARFVVRGISGRAARRDATRQAGVTRRRDGHDASQRALEAPGPAQQRPILGGERAAIASADPAGSRRRQRHEASRRCAGTSRRVANRRRLRRGRGVPRRVADRGARRRGMRAAAWGRGAGAVGSRSTRSASSATDAETACQIRRYAHAGSDSPSASTPTPGAGARHSRWPSWEYGRVCRSDSTNRARRSPIRSPGGPAPSGSSPSAPVRACRRDAAGR